MNNKFFEWMGVTTAILYSLFVALNIGLEFVGFSLLLLSAALIGIWAYRGKHKGILLLQFFMLVPLSLEWLDGFEHKKNFSDHYFILNSYF